MDERTSKRFPAAHLAALSIITLMCAACDQGPMAPATGHVISKNGGFSLSLPGNSWKKELHNSNPGEFLNLIHEDSDNGLGPSIHIYEHKGRTRKELEALRQGALNARKDDPSYRALPIQEINLDGRSGLVEDVASMNALAAAMHRKDGGIAFKPVLYRETTVYVMGPTRSYTIRYAAPQSLYDKHRPAFDQLLASFKFAD